MHSVMRGKCSLFTNVAKALLQFHNKLNAPTFISTTFFKKVWSIYTKKVACEVVLGVVKY